MNQRSVLDFRLCSYTICRDTGFAPNPFWGYCTLAVCTPNHQGIRAQTGDWFIGHQAVKRGSKLVFAMQVSEVLCFDAYYGDARFQKKKPVLKGTWRQRCGDNIYYRDDRGQWRQHPHSCYHRESELIRQDLKHPFVFVAAHYYYFGHNAVALPKEYASLIRKRQGVKCRHDLAMVEGFLDWLQSNFRPGIHGHPHDNHDAEGC